MNSMTGYGRGESGTTETRCVVECYSVNRKGSEVACQLPRELAPLEIPIRDLVLKRIARGRVNVTVSLPAAAGGHATEIDHTLAVRILADARELQATLQLGGTLDINTILNVPGVLRVPEQSTTDFWPTVESALKTALDAMCAMRAREGAHLAKDLRKRLGLLRRARSRMLRCAAQVATRYRRDLQQRLLDTKFTLPIDETRLATEIALFAERCDVTEELTRLESHFAQFEEKLDASDPSGRAFEFLTQEIYRELNTLGSKAGDSLLSRLVVESKVELDKIREQISNVE